eukprot:TRINITY_DN120485_c4_g1_i1.p1 TRINITY_DN120485_c4_g1~~TRINITY_DN120485_c4_g1_i1.p1  ORF type:complete len:546 (-),score=69.07 TRINITY_DN120485_c4_g1_i1:3892-5529(-)
MEQGKTATKASFSEEFYANYSIRELIWTGSYSRIYKAVHTTTKEPVAVKVLKREYYESDREAFKNLTDIMNALCNLTHPNIVRTYDVYKDSEHYYIVMEYLNGKSLLDYIKSLSGITEKVVAGIMQELLSALSYAHKRSIIHGSLSFANIIIVQPAGLPTLKVIGFAGDPSLMERKNPTQKDAIFYSPEKAAKKEVSVYASDVWACGIIYSSLLSGLIPFTVKRFVEDTLEEIKKCEVTLEKLKEGPWKKVTTEAKQFLCRMLEKDPEKRSSAGALLYDKWISNASEKTVVTEELKGLCSQMHHLKGTSSMQNAILYYLSERAKSSLLQAKAAPLLKEMDKAGTGKITKADFITVLEKLGVSNKAEAEDVFTKLDLTGDGILSYTEIISAFFGKSLAKREENLKIAFDDLDLDHSGDLDADEILTALCGSDTTGDLARKIKKELEGFKGKKIKYPEFVKLMRDLNQMQYQALSTNKTYINMKKKQIHIDRTKTCPFLLRVTLREINNVFSCIIRRTVSTRSSNLKIKKRSWKTKRLKYIHGWTLL